MIDTRGKNLIFLISQPRAGSTLLQLMLSGHPEIATTSEPWIALHPLYALRDRGLVSEFDSFSARQALGEFLDQSGTDAAFYREQTAVFLSALYSRAATHQGKTIFLDKTPRYYYIFDELVEIFPEAKFLILLRNPLAVLNSILKTWVKEDLGLLGYYRDDLTLAPQKLIDGLRKHPGRCFGVKYEELIQRPEEVVRAICEYLGITYSSGLIDYGDRKRPDWKLGDPVGVHRATRPTPASLDSWKKGFSSPQSRLFAASYLAELGAELVKEMGYDYDELMAQVRMEEGEVQGLVSWKEAAGMDSDLQVKTLLMQRDALLNSLSWRITAPLRSSLDLMRRLKPAKK